VVKADYVTQHGLHNGSVQQQVIGRPLVFHVIDNVISGLWPQSDGKGILVKFT